mgnify:CR=1 FL=1
MTNQWVLFVSNSTTASRQIREKMAEEGRVIIVDAIRTLVNINSNRTRKWVDEVANLHHTTVVSARSPEVPAVKAQCGKEILTPKGLLSHQNGCKRCRAARGRQEPTPSQNGAVEVIPPEPARLNLNLLMEELKTVSTRALTIAEEADQAHTAALKYRDSLEEIKKLQEQHAASLAALKGLLG